MEAPVLDKIKAALQSAYNAGSDQASGYISALCGMRSVNNLGRGDAHAEKCRAAWAAKKDAVALELYKAIVPPCPVCKSETENCDMSRHQVGDAEDGIYFLGTR